MKRLVFVVIIIAVFTNYAFQSVGMASIAQGVSITESDPCGYFNSIEIQDPPGDATPGAPPYVDILGVNVRQFGQYVQFEWLAGGNPYNEENFFFTLVVDADRNPDTGRRWGDIGAEFRIGVENYRDSSTGLAVFFYYETTGELVSLEKDYHVTLSDEGFIINVEKSKIPSNHFNLYFEASGFPPWRDEGTSIEIQLQAAGDPVLFRIDSPNTVLESKPKLINIPQKSEGVQLSPSVVSGKSTIPLSPSEITYSVTHPVTRLVPDAESIISVDTGGLASYNNEGFVRVTVTDSVCHFKPEEIIMATGDVYGNPETQQVIAVFPTDYVPDASIYSFGDMMSSFPDYMRYLNMGYEVTSGMYNGFLPFEGDKQILAILDAEGHCGGANNPLEVAPGCYMNYSDGSPHYNVVIHEMGHNFDHSMGINQLLYTEGAKLAVSGLMECVASLPVIYYEEEITHNGTAYEVYPGSFEYEYARANRAHFCAEPQRGLPGFEQMITDGLTEGIFDNNGLFGGTHVFCSFFEAFSCDYIDGENPHKHEMIRRFLNIFSDSELPGFISEKVDTYFAAAYSVAAGRDMRTQLQFWGFTIDNAYYEQVVPLITLRVNDSENFQINPGLNDAWYNPETDGQGFFITVFPDIGYVSLSWFTYDTERPEEGVTANLGEPGHRWLNALGQYSGNRAEMGISITSGGVFDTPTEVKEVIDGTIILTFTGCTSGTVEYDIPSIGGKGTVPIQRVVGDNIAFCESYAEQASTLQTRVKKITDNNHTSSYEAPVTTADTAPLGNMNVGLNDAWYYPVTNGQGFFINVFPDIGYVSLSWFTYDTERPEEGVTANLGEPSHRWLNALGQYSGNRAEMGISITSGGVFDTPTEVTEVNDGTIILTFTDCENGTIEYDIPSINQQGIVPIQRVVSDNIALCETLNTD